MRRVADSDALSGFEETEGEDETTSHYRQLAAGPSRDSKKAVRGKSARTAKKRADIQAAIREHIDEAAGEVWACCVASEIDLATFHQQLGNNEATSTKPRDIPVVIEGCYSEVLVCKAFKRKLCFLFRFGCVVGWDFSPLEQQVIKAKVAPFMSQPLPKPEEDDMSYVWGRARRPSEIDDPGTADESDMMRLPKDRKKQPMIRHDRIVILSADPLERLAYSYAFAQSCKLAVFEMVVDDTILATKALPEGLAATGKINSNRHDLSRRMGDLFINRFYINLHTDILDTPDIFWEFDEFSDHYTSCRGYLEIPNRVEILNQRLDIIKDLYDMLNNELTIQHGYKLEWIVIYLICIEVVIEVVWNILIRDILKWV
eukprot:GHVN01096587.1.p2 GENE.GHVN01096587.1~~GHVN01096587.1.p2  ORF type:complete len:372 (+),score=40.10 GHVN01096587.1:2529-3644(+)